MESTQEQHSTPNTGAVAEKQPYRQRKYDNADDNGETERRPFKPRGEYRGSYRGRGNTDNEGGEGRGSYRGRGRGNTDYEGRPFRSRGGRGRGGFNKDVENVEGTEDNQQVADDTENAYKSRPYNNYNRERGSDQPWRSRGGRGDNQRGSYRGDRGDRGGRGGYTRGGYRQNWEEARQLKQDELNSDEEVVNVTPAQKTFIEEMQEYARKNIKILNDDQIVNICLEHNFDLHKVQAHFKKFAPEDKYSGLEAYEW